jgi:hypothetical protein
MILETLANVEKVECDASLLRERAVLATKIVQGTTVRRDSTWYTGNKVPPAGSVAIEKLSDQST